MHGIPDPPGAGIRQVTVEGSASTSLTGPASRQSVVDVLETGAASLLALEATLEKVASCSGEHSRVQDELRSAIDLVRSALGELSRTSERGISGQVALGFVTRRRRSPNVK